MTNEEIVVDEGMYVDGSVLFEQETNEEYKYDDVINDAELMDEVIRTFIGLVNLNNIIQSLTT